VKLSDLFIYNLKLVSGLFFTVGVTNVDNGNYTCEIRTPEGNILGGVTHSIFVRGKCNRKLSTLILAPC